MHMLMPCLGMLSSHYNLNILYMPSLIVTLEVLVLLVKYAKVILLFKTNPPITSRNLYVEDFF